MLCSAVVLLIHIPAAAQATKPVSEADPAAAIGALRTELVEAFNKGDVDRLLSHLDPDVVVTWQNGEVCRGPAQVRAYYDRMMSGPQRIVKSLSCNPVVDDRHVYGDWAVSWGNLHDSYVLNDGSEFRFDSRFTASIARRGDAWKVTSFHASVNAFNNPILGIAAKKGATWAGAIAGLLGLLIGAALAFALTRRNRTAAPPAGSGG
jgi:ketosteroid isomerase-like protein